MCTSIVTDDLSTCGTASHALIVSVDQSITLGQEKSLISCRHFHAHTERERERKPMVAFFARVLQWKSNPFWASVIFYKNYAICRKFMDLVWGRLFFFTFWKSGNGLEWAGLHSISIVHLGLLGNSSIGPKHTPLIRIKSLFFPFYLGESFVGKNWFFAYIQEAND